MASSHDGERALVQNSHEAGGARSAAHQIVADGDKRHEYTARSHKVKFDR